MITLKTDEQIELMRIAGKVTREAIAEVGKLVAPGVTTKQLDKIAEEYIRDNNGVPSFLGYSGFPGSICASINDEVVHGIPSDKRVLKEGDIIGIDCGAIVNGWQGDAARTFPVGNISSEAESLIDLTKQSFFEGLKYCKAGYRLGDVSSAIQNFAEAHNLGVVRVLCGHGIGRQMHEAPEVPNFGKAGRGIKLQKGLVIAIEPMLNFGTYDVYTDKENGWTVYSKDHSLSCHYENTVAITDGEPELLTLLS